MSIISQPIPKRPVDREPHLLRHDHEIPQPAESDWTTVGFESGHWFQHVSPVREYPGLPGQDPLHRSAIELPGNLRYAWDGTRMLLIGEVPIAEEADQPIAEAAERLRTLLSDCSHTSSTRESSPAPDNELLATLLADCGFAFQQRERGWVLPAQGGLSEVTVSAGPGGVWVESVLTTGERIDEASRKAMELFLCRAHRRVRFARFVLNEADVRVVSFAETDWLETDLVASVHAVLSAGNRFRHLVSALRSPELAGAYLEGYAREAESSS